MTKAIQFSHLNPVIQWPLGLAVASPNQSRRLDSCPGYTRDMNSKGRLTEFNRAQVWRFCKENPLVTHADIAGKVSVNWSPKANTTPWTC